MEYEKIENVGLEEIKEEIEYEEGIVRVNKGSSKKMEVMLFVEEIFNDVTLSARDRKLTKLHKELEILRKDGYYSAQNITILKQQRSYLQKTLMNQTPNIKKQLF